MTINSVSEQIWHKKHPEESMLKLWRVMAVSTMLNGSEVQILKMEQLRTEVAGHTLLDTEYNEDTTEVVTQSIFYMTTWYRIGKSKL
jgi:hypothetical protein